MSLVAGARHWYRKGGLTQLFRAGATFAAGQAIVRATAGSYERTLAELGSPGDHAQTWEFQDVAVAAVPGACLVGPHAAVLGPDRVYGDALRESATKTRWMLHEAIRQRPRLVGQALRQGAWPGDPPCVEGPATVLYHHSGNYYHWIVEQVASLWAVEQYEAATGQDGEVTIIVPSDVPGFVTAALSRAGVSDRIHEWDGEPLELDEYIVPSLPAHRKVELRWLRERVGRRAVGESGEEWLYVSRADSDRGRRVRNLDVLEEVFDDYDITVVQPEQWSLAEEIRRFADAAGVIGPHGAGLTAMVWLTDGAVVELQNDVYNPTYPTLAESLGHDYECVRCDSVGRPSKPKNADLRADPDAVRAALERATSTDALDNLSESGSQRADQDGGMVDG